MDTLLSGLLGLKRFWADTAISAVTTVAIIVHLNVLENSATHLFPGGKAFTMDDFHLHRVDKALGADIVVAVALGAHAAYQRKLCQQALI